MKKQSSDKSRKVTIPSPGFWGIPLYFGPLGKELRSDMMRETGEYIAEFANGRWQSCHTTSGWSDSTEGDRQMVIRWLSKLPNLPPRMLNEIANYAKQVEPQSTEIFSKVKKGNIELRSMTACRSPTCKVAYGYLMASLLSAGHGENFAKCPECGTWFFDVPSGRPMKKFCNQTHSNRYRQRKYREKQK